MKRCGAVNSVSVLVAHTISTSLHTNALSGRFVTLIIIRVYLPPNCSHPVLPFLSSSSRLSSRDSHTLRQPNYCSLQHKSPCDIYPMPPRVPNLNPTHRPTRSRRSPRTIDSIRRSQCDPHAPASHAREYRTQGGARGDGTCFGGLLSVYDAS